MDRKKIIQVVITVAAVFACGIAYLVLGPGKSSSESMVESLAVDEQISEEGVASGSGVSGEVSSITPEKVYVYVCGAVKNPGVYTFDTEPRAIEAVEMAGGLTKKADKTAVNLALKLYDGAQLVIPEKGKQSTGQSQGVVAQSDGNYSQASSETSDGRININTADKTELMKIPGIGEAKAASIISYREQNGGFAKPEDIKNITGIKDGVYNKIKDYITV